MIKRHHLLKTATLLSFISMLIINESYGDGFHTTANMQVSVTVIGSCTLTTTNFVFNNYDPAAVDDKHTGTNAVTINCADGVAYTADLSPGNSGNYAQRYMTFGTDQLNYNLYRDSARANIWGDGSPGTVHVAVNGNGLPQNYTVYGTIPAGQNTVPTGALFTDNILVTVNY